jgi:hypothetical protein
MMNAYCISMVKPSTKLMISYFGRQTFDTFSATFILDPGFTVFAHAMDGFPMSTTSHQNPQPGSTTKKIPGPTSTSITSGQASSTDTSSTDSSHLSGADIAGVVIGVISALALIVLATVYFLSYRRKKRRSEQWPGSDATNFELDPSYIGNRPPGIAAKIQMPIELNNSGRQELGDSTRQELGDSTRYELP